ncbi:large ribosomal subunit protein bL19cy-like [Humulus lupulus]|uniref:large ribosomal subunit protein bL19cy-like n=1 Tax=Humulus lupulus TaxID=3486 RepID=UPI002B407FEC|nr:large ribosomal subunit protein bL19cy-like [Humulus lupulus]
MASKVLPQAVITIPRNPNQATIKNLGLTNVVSRRHSLLNSARLWTSKVSTSSIGSNFGPLLAAANGRRCFVVRAEANSEGEAEAAGSGVENEEGGVEEASEVNAEGEGVLESEEVKPPRKPRVKLGDIMGILNTRAVEESQKERPVPDIRTGDIVEIKFEVPENRRRLSVYKGIVISRQNAGIHTTIRIRRIIAGVGVEIVFPLYSPNIKEIRVMSHRKVRRARLYYLRDKLPRLSTFK